MNYSILLLHLSSALYSRGVVADVVLALSREHFGFEYLCSQFHDNDATSFGLTVRLI